MTDQLTDLIADMVKAEVARQLAARDSVDEYLSVRSAADLADVAPGTVRRWIREGRIQRHGAGRHLRVRRADLLAFLTSGNRQDRALTPEERALKDFS